MAESMPYAEYLKTPHWQRARKTALRFADKSCQVCCGVQKLQVHHRTYERVGHERLADLLVLCETCHELFEAHRAQLKKPATINVVRWAECSVAALLEAQADENRPPGTLDLQGERAAAFGSGGLNDEHIKEPLVEEMGQMQARVADPLVGVGLRTGYDGLDGLALFQPGALIVLAARPSIGKTAFACNLAANVAADGDNGVLVLHFHESKRQLVQRFLCVLGKFDGLRLQKGWLEGNETEELLSAATRLSKMPIHLAECQRNTIEEITVACRSAADRYCPALVILDELHHVRGADRLQQLKLTAKALGVPVLALAGVTNRPESRGDKRPKLADLREAEEIEQHADVVIILHRDDAYDPSERPGEADLFVALNRNGPTGIVPLTWVPESTRFESWTPAESEGGWVGDSDF